MRVSKVLFRSFIAVFLLMAAGLPGLMIPAGGAIAQEASPTAISCSPTLAQPIATIAATPAAVAEVPGEMTKVKIGYVPVAAFAPMMIARDKGYFAEEGLDVELVPFPGGADPFVLTASGDLDFALAGAGPAFWNGLARDLDITVISPGHMEGNPVATPLMISVGKCESGEITSIADLKGKKVSINSRGATEYWLDQALRSGGLTIDDIQLEQLPFPDAVAGLASGAVDAAMIGEPLATKAEQDGIALRLASSFDIQDMQPTLVFGNDKFIAENPDAAAGVVTAFLRAARDLMDPGYADPANLAIIEAYTGVPAALIAAAVPSIYEVDGQFNIEALQKLQAFFRDRELLEYKTDLDPESFIDRQYVDSALAELNPNSP